MKKLLIIILLLFVNNAHALIYDFTTFPEAMEACQQFTVDASHLAPFEYTCTGYGGGELTSDTLYTKRVVDSNPAYKFTWDAATECPDGSILNETTFVCECPTAGEELINNLCTTPPRDAAECLALQGVAFAFGVPQSQPMSGTICAEGCTAGNLIGSSNGDSDIVYTGTYDGGNCAGNDIPNASTGTTNQPGCITSTDGSEICNGPPMTEDGQPLPDYPEPDGASKTPNDNYTSDGDTENASENSDVTEIHNDNGSTNVHDDYQSLPPGTPVDTNGDGKSDATTVDTTGDGATDTIQNNDGTTFSINNPDGSAGAAGEGSGVNDDGSPNYPDSGGEEEDKPCEDDPATTADECLNEEDNTASTPYCNEQPLCDGDVHQCANIFQNWQILCANMVPEGTDTSDSLNQTLPEDDGSQFYDPLSESDNIKLDEITLDDSGFGFSRACPMPYTYSIFSETYEFVYTPICDLATILSFILLISATLISIRIIGGD